MERFTYLLLNLGSLSIPLAYSFTRHSGFSTRFGPALAAISLAALPFLAGDIGFAALGIWSFNPHYHLGVGLGGLPVEEFLFFLCIPFACLFVYDFIRRAPRLWLPEKMLRLSFAAAGASALAAAALLYDRAYSLFAFGLGASLAFALAAGALGRHLRPFATALLVHYVPFFLVNGWLTALPVVRYNDAENSGLRLGSIPVEDAAYSFLMLGLTVLLYETFLKRRQAEHALA